MRIFTGGEIMIAAMEKDTIWLTAFEAFDRRSLGPAWLRGLRQKAFARFWELGFPTVHDEDWRFTSVAPIAGTAFAFPEGACGVVLEDLRPYVLEDTACRLVFVNGRFVPELSERGAIPANVNIDSLASALAADGAAVERHLGKYEDFRDDAFTALNTAFLEDGALVSIPRNTVLEKPIYLFYVSAGNGAPQMTHPRNLIVVGEQAQAAIVEDYVSLGNGVSLSNAVTEVVAGESSVVEHYLVEREDRQAYNISTLRLQQGRSANVASHSVLLGGALVRNNVHPVLDGEGGECLINGLFIGGGQQHMDNYMKVEHRAPHCGSRQFYNGILDQRARGVFHGRIIVHKGAQKTDAKQTNRNLLLSDDAQIDTKPQLEIYADDVKCTHGATIGQIDEEALFYLRSRGLPEREARGLLLFAFAHECLDRMKSAAVREWLSLAVAAWLPQESMQAVAPPAMDAPAHSQRNWKEVL
jgi:Fe-S cluster assembly protein SufD